MRGVALSLSQSAACFAFSPARALSSQPAAINPRRQCSL